MKPAVFSVIRTIGAAAVLLLSGFALGAEEKAQTKSGADQAVDPMMAEMIKYATPGAQHASLAKMTGSWKTTIKSFQGPGEPQVSTGTSETKAILGGRFIQEHFSSDMGGQPFEGFGLTGYDLLRNAYTGTWVDSWGTGIMTTTGKAEPDGKTINWTGVGMDPISKAEKKSRMVTRIADDNKHSFELYDTWEGKEFLSMEISYTRM